MTSADSVVPRSVEPNSLHVLSVLVQDQFGVLARVAGLFSRRGFNIYSLAVAPTHDARFSRITIVVDARSAPLEQVTKQLNKLINVITISEIDPANSVERELGLFTVEADADAPELAAALVGFGGVEVLEHAGGSVIVSFSGKPTRVDALENRLEALGLAEIQRTGRIALTSLPREGQLDPSGLDDSNPESSAGSESDAG